MTALLDVNVLIALAWPNHVHHEAARAWFLAHAREGWATCPLTESGFVRVSSNHQIMPVAVTPAEAILVLARLREHEGHEFWEDDVSIVTSPHLPRARLVTHRQVTDAHLLSLAGRHGGRLTTFDGGTRSLAGPASDQLLLVLSPN